MHHRSWREASSRDLDAEISGARAVLEEITQRAVDLAACPFGLYDRRVLRALPRTGYQHVFTSDGGSDRDGSWMQARTSLRRADAHLVLDRVCQVESASSWLVQDLKLIARRWR